MKIVANRDVCIGSGNCVLTDPEVFDQDDDGLVEVVDDSPEAARRPTVEEAVLRCPSQALSLAD